MVWLLTNNVKTRVQTSQLNAFCLRPKVMELINNFKYKCSCVIIAPPQKKRSMIGLEPQISVVKNNLFDSIIDQVRSYLVSLFRVLFSADCKV